MMPQVSPVYCLSQFETGQMWLWKVNMEPLHSVPTLATIPKMRYTSFPIITAANQSFHHVPNFAASSFASRLCNFWRNCGGIVATGRLSL